MKKIICPNCGEVDVYGYKETVRHMLLFDVDDAEVFSTEGVTIYESNIKRCLCGKKVKIIEDVQGETDEPVL